MGPSAYNPLWTGMQPGMEGYMTPYAAPMPYMGYGPGPLDMPFGGFIPQDPFAANCMYPIPPQRYGRIIYFSKLSFSCVLQHLGLLTPSQVPASLIWMGG